MTELEMKAELERLKAENEALKAKREKAAKLSFKVGDKGALSVYHGSRFPVTLYAQQWANLLKDENIASIKEALVYFKDQLKTKE